eukprot:1151985-Pelagomonas_calceolata.AAC.11
MQAHSHTRIITSRAAAHLAPGSLFVKAAPSQRASQAQCPHQCIVAVTPLAVPTHPKSSPLPTSVHGACWTYGEAGPETARHQWRYAMTPKT